MPTPVARHIGGIGKTIAEDGTVGITGNIVTMDGTTDVASTSTEVRTGIDIRPGYTGSSGMTTGPIGFRESGRCRRIAWAMSAASRLIRSVTIRIHPG